MYFQKKYSSATPVIRIIDGFEPAEFTNLFPAWRSSATAPTGAIKNVLNIGKFDAQTLFNRPKLAATSQLHDDGTGEITIYKVNGKQLLPIHRRKLVALFSGDCFLIHYIVTVSITTTEAKNIYTYLTNFHSFLKII